MRDLEYLLSIPTGTNLSDSLLKCSPAAVGTIFVFIMLSVVHRRTGVDIPFETVRPNPRVDHPIMKLDCLHPTAIVLEELFKARGTLGSHHVCASRSSRFKEEVESSLFLGFHDEFFPTIRPNGDYIRRDCRYTALAYLLNASNQFVCKPD